MIKRINQRTKSNKKCDANKQNKNYTNKRINFQRINAQFDTQESAYDRQIRSGLTVHA